MVVRHRQRQMGEDNRRFTWRAVSRQRAAGQVRHGRLQQTFLDVITAKRDPPRLLLSPQPRTGPGRQDPIVGRRPRLLHGDLLASATAFAPVTCAIPGRTVAVLPAGTRRSATVRLLSAYSMVLPAYARRPVRDVLQDETPSSDVPPFCIGAVGATASAVNVVGLPPRGLRPRCASWPIHGFCAGCSSSDGPT